MFTTITATTTLGVKAKHNGVAERQATVTSALVPPYASACSGAVDYSSACSCWGITASITTAPAPITTITETVTLTTSVCPLGGRLCDSHCYNLRTSSDNCGSCGYRVSNPFLKPCSPLLENAPPITLIRLTHLNSVPQEKHA